MNSHRVTGLALIVGALVMIVAIAVHPLHGPGGSGGEAALRNNVVVVFLVTSLGLLGVGFLRLLRSMGPQAWTDVAFVALALAGVCGSLAAVNGHLVIPRLVERMNAANEAEQAIVNGIVANDRILSGALMQTSFAAWAVGVLCVSISMLHSSAGWRVLGACGIVLGLSILLALSLGRLQITLHDIGLTVLASGIWLIAIGAGLCANNFFGELRVGT